MNLKNIIDELHLTPLTKPVAFEEIQPTSGYSSDLLSCVMAGAKSNCIWVTLQAHQNIIGVAALLDMSAVIISEGAEPDPTTITKADSQSVILLSTPKSSFEVIGNLWKMGLRN